MTSIFEQAGMWPEAGKKNENKDLEPGAYLEEIAQGLATIKADTPADKLEQVRSFAGTFKHFTDELLWQGLNNKILCTHDIFEKLKDVHQEFGNYTMTFPVSQVDFETLSKLEPYFSDYKLEHNSSENSKFHVFVKKEANA